MNIWIPIAFLLLLSACTSIDTVKMAVAVKGAKISDTALKDAVWWTCEGSSIGAVKRLYETTTERASLYREFCKGSGTANVIGD